MNNLIFYEDFDDEIYKKYAQMPKEKLLQIIISKEKTIEKLLQKIELMDHDNDCTDWNHCKNPYHDCINCPLRFVYNPNSNVTINVQEYNENNNYGNSITCSKIFHNETTSDVSTCYTLTYAIINDNITWETI